MTDFYKHDKRNFINADYDYTYPVCDYDGDNGFANVKQKYTERDTGNRRANEHGYRHTKNYTGHEEYEKPRMGWRTMALSGDFFQSGWHKHFDPYFVPVDYDSTQGQLGKTKQSNQEGRPCLKIFIFSILLLVVIAVPTAVVIVFKLEDNKSSSVYNVEVKMELTLDRVFTKDLEDKTSNEYKSLTGEFCQEVINAFQSKGSVFQQHNVLCEVTKIRDGSTIMEFILKLQGKTNTNTKSSVFVSTLTTALGTDSKLGLLPVKSSSIRVISILYLTSTKTTLAPTTATTDPTTTTTEPTTITTQLTTTTTEPTTTTTTAPTTTTTEPTTTTTEPTTTTTEPTTTTTEPTSTTTEPTTTTTQPTTTTTESTTTTTEPTTTTTEPTTTRTEPTTTTTEPTTTTTESTTTTTEPTTTTTVPTTTTTEPTTTTTVPTTTTTVPTTTTTKPTTTTTEPTTTTTEHITTTIEPTTTTTEPTTSTTEPTTTTTEPTTTTTEPTTTTTEPTTTTTEPTTTTTEPTTTTTEPTTTTTEPTTTTTEPTTTTTEPTTTTTEPTTTTTEPTTTTTEPTTTTTEPTTTTPPETTVSVEDTPDFTSDMHLTKATWDDDFSDPTSDTYKNFTNKVESEVDSIFLKSNLKDIYNRTEVTSLEKGSVKCKLETFVNRLSYTITDQNSQVVRVKLETQDFQDSFFDGLQKHTSTTEDRIIEIEEDDLQVERTTRKQEDIEEVCVSKSDIIFLLDESGSIGADNFITTKTFVSNYASRADFKENATQIGIVVFDHYARTAFQMNTYRSAGQIVPAINAIHYSNGGTDIGYALSYADTNAFTTSNGARTDAFKIVVLMTDGRSNDASAQAKVLKDKGIVIMCIAIGSGADYDQLNKVVSKPEYVLSVTDFGALQKVEHILLEATCETKYNCSGDIMKLQPTGRKIGGLPTSNQEAEADVDEIKKRKHCYTSAGRNNCIHPALIAAIASRESRAGRLLQSTTGYGDNGAAYGIMQCDINACPVCPDYDCKIFAWDSCEHIIMMTTKVLVPYIEQVQTKHPTWTMEQQMQGGVAAYNFGVSNVQTWQNLDVGTTGDDYSNDVIARAQYLVNKNIW